MFRSTNDHHQGVYVFLVKITELKCEYSDVVMRQHNIFCLYVVSGVVWPAECRVCTPHHTHKLPDDDQLLIETCQSAFKCFSV
jgi:hypothetical protein